MAVSDGQLQAAILTAIGETSSGPVGSQLAVLWALFDEKRHIVPRLQYYYVLVEAGAMMIGSLSATAVDVEDTGQKTKLHQQIETLEVVVARAEKEIAKIEKLARSNRAPATKAITAVEPIAPNDLTETTGLSDPAHRRYRGDPLFPGVRRP